MKKIVTSIALLLVALLAFYMLSTKQNTSNTAPTNDTTSTNNTTVTETPTNNTSTSNKTTPENAEIVAYGFIQDFIAIAPPEPDQTAVERIMHALSNKAKAKIRQETIASDLAKFIGVQDVPDQGASVEDLQIVSPSESYLVVGLNYSGGRVLRNVHLIAEEGEWKVERVSASQTKAEVFDTIGNLVQNNPGMKLDVWYLVYEGPGQPALSTELEFTESSICAEGVENTTCDLSALTQGSRVRILGEKTDQDTVRVTRLELK